MSTPTHLSSEGASGDAAWCRWRRFAMLLSAPGACLAVLMWGVTSVVGIGTVPFLVGWAAQACGLCSSHAPRSVPTGVDWRTCGQAALASGAVVVGLGGIGAVSWSGTALVVVLLVLRTPPVVASLRRMVAPRAGSAGPRPEDEAVLMAPRDPGPPTVPLLLALLAEPAAQMSRPRLCRAWRQSFEALQGARTVAERVRLVELRQSYLDEIEVRDAAALGAWLADGARAAGGPERYLAAGERPRPDTA